MRVVVVEVEFVAHISGRGPVAAGVIVDGSRLPSRPTVMIERTSGARIPIRWVELHGVETERCWRTGLYLEAETAHLVTSGSILTAVVDD